MPTNAVGRSADVRDGQTDLYRWFAVLLAPPSRECFDFLSQPAVARGLEDLGGRGGGRPDGQERCCTCEQDQQPCLHHHLPLLSGFKVRWCANRVIDRSEKSSAAPRSRWWGAGVLGGDQPSADEPDPRAGSPWGPPGGTLRSP